MSDYKLIIYREDNGYILSGKDFNTDSLYKIVIEDDDKDVLKSHESLLWEIMDYFCLGGSKHDEERLRVTREKQYPKGKD